MWQASKMAQAEAHDAALRCILFKWQWVIALHGACTAETLTRFGAAQPRAADSTVMTESAAIAPAKTCARTMCVVTNTEPKGVLQLHHPGCCISCAMRTVERLFFMAMIAAMKNVLSPISDTRIIPLQLKEQSIISTVQVEACNSEGCMLCFLSLTMT